MSTQGKQRGFTLIELLITLAIMGVAIIPMMSSYVRTWQATVESERRTTAVMLARQRLEVLSGTREINSIGDGSGSFNPPFKPYNYTVKAEDLSGPDPDVEAKLLKIKVDFKSIYGGRRTISCARNATCPQWDYAKTITAVSP